MEVQQCWDDIAPGEAFPNLWNKQDLILKRYGQEYARLEGYDDQVSRLMKELELEGDA